jgi:two-component system chemotaxis response regulator CheB
MPEDVYAPSIDRLFKSLAQSPLVERLHAVVLTGMGHDGAQGVKALARRGATVWAEAEATAVVFGMPEAAIATGAVDHVLELPRLGADLARSLKRQGR